MKVLLDECLPRKLKYHLSGHECHTVPDVGWAGKKNGELLFLAEESGFEIFLTLDQGIEYEQNLEGRKITIILVDAKSSQLADLLPRVPFILQVIRERVGTGHIFRVSG
jgi:PIN like domain